MTPLVAEIARVRQSAGRHLIRSQEVQVIGHKACDPSLCFSSFETWWFDWDRGGCSLEWKLEVVIKLLMHGKLAGWAGLR